jgi:hypothetical protein
MPLLRGSLSGAVVIASVILGACSSGTDPWQCKVPKTVDTTGWIRHAGLPEGISISLPPEMNEYRPGSVEWSYIWHANGRRFWVNGGNYQTGYSPDLPEWGHCRMQLDGRPIDITTHNKAPVWLHGVWLPGPQPPGGVGGDSQDPKDLPLIWTALLTLRFNDTRSR